MHATPGPEQAELYKLPRENNLDLLRLLFAWLVVVIHIHDLSRAPQFWIIGRCLRSHVAVEGFFAISGCLIVASWENRPEWRVYLKRRAQRILPGYLLALLYSLAVGAWFTTLPWKQFALSRVTWRYIACNLLFAGFLQNGLPGVFQHNPIDAMDGALWTLKVEVGFYLLVPSMVWCCRRFGPGKTLAAIFLLSAVYRASLDALHRPILAYQLPGQLCFFAMGAAVYYFADTFHRHRVPLLCVALVPAVLGIWLDWPVARALGMPLLVLGAGYLLPAHRGMTRFGDFSYGAYVLHFPTVQMFVALGLFAVAPWRSFAEVCGCVAVLSVFSWFAVERPFLRRARLVPVSEGLTAPAHA